MYRHFIGMWSEIPLAGRRGRFSQGYRGFPRPISSRFRFAFFYIGEMPVGAIQSMVLLNSDGNP